MIVSNVFKSSSKLFEKSYKQIQKKSNNKKKYHKSYKLSDTTEILLKVLFKHCPEVNTKLMKSLAIFIFLRSNSVRLVFSFFLSGQFCVSNPIASFRKFKVLNCRARALCIHSTFRYNFFIQIFWK